MKRLVALDIETYDPGLKTTGTSACRSDDGGRILCCGAYGDGISRVFDFDNKQDIQQLRDIMKDSTIDKIFHNGIYDLSWLYCHYDFEINGVLHDTMTRAAFIDEYQQLSLDACCKKMGLQGKNKTETIEAWYEEWQRVMKGCAKGFKKKLYVDSTVYNIDDGCDYKLDDEEISAIVTGDYKKDLWSNVMFIWNSSDGRSKMKEYNLQDCIATYNLFQKQEPFMKDYAEAYAVECDIYYLLLQMKKVGVRIDMNALGELTQRVDEQRVSVEKELIDLYGIDSETIASPKKLGARLNEMNIYSPIKTARGSQSWGVDAFDRLSHVPVIQKIHEYKTYDAIASRYLHGDLRNSIYNGRVHCTFSPNKREDGGTVTGRFASSGPNLQNIPANDKGQGINFAQDMRALFIPEEGCMMGAFDYSQIEYLLLAHYAKGPQADEFRAQANAGVDFHTVAMKMTGITYRPLVKRYNYGVIYGMGWRTSLEKNYTLFEKLAAKHNMSPTDFAKSTYEQYHAKMPVVHDTMQWCQNLAKVQGFVTCLGGRRQHKPKATYDPSTGKINDYIYKMLNKLIQCSAAYVLKFALQKAYKAGLFNVLTMHITVHDENVASIPFNKEGTEAAQELKHIMDTSFSDELLVPMKACGEVGPNWGYWSDDIWNEMCKGNFDESFFAKDYRETH